MEKTKMNYQNGKIYTIRSFQTDGVYYGSTTQPLSKRLSGHKAHYRHWQQKNGKYTTSFEIIKFDDCYIELYELYPCNSKTELEKREGEIIRVKDDAVNKVIAGRTKKEYDKKYRVDNRNKINQKQICVCGMSCIKRNMEVHFNTIKHNNYVNGVIIEKWKRDDKQNCICGGRYTNCHKSEHLRSKKHLTYLESIAHNIDTP
jgi:hypothetical protein